MDKSDSRSDKNASGDEGQKYNEWASSSNYIKKYVADESHVNDEQASTSKYNPEQTCNIIDNLDLTKEGQLDNEHASTSKFNPDHTCNSNDLKILNVNSADDVRQTMKAVLAAKVPLTFNQEVDQNKLQIKHKHKEPINIIVITENRDQNILILNKSLRRGRGFKSSSENEQNSSRNVIKRGDRSPDAGPFKRIKRDTISSMYIGKLSNVAGFQRKKENNTGLSRK